jgi:hypothetical protein
MSVDLWTKMALTVIADVALLTDLKTDPLRERTIKAYQAAAQALDITLWPVDIGGPEDIEPVFAKIAEDRADGVVRGTSGGLFFSLRIACSSGPTSSMSLRRLVPILVHGRMNPLGECAQH